MSTWKTCAIHGDDNPNAWGCPECLRELREIVTAINHALAAGHSGNQILDENSSIRYALNDVARKQRG